MKKLLLAGTCLCFLLLANQQLGFAQQHSLQKIWQTDSVLKTPESVLFDGQHTLYFSNIGGAPDGKNGKGSIGKMDPQGQHMVVEWVKGMNGPKGLGRSGNTLYAADIDEVVEIDIPSASIKGHIPVEGAQFLNDISVDAHGAVFVSDTKLGKVFKIENGKASLYVDGIEGANGVLAVGADLYVLGSGNLWKVSPDHNKTKVAEGMEKSTDGIERVNGNDFIVSCWSGVIYYVEGNGKSTLLLDTRPEKSNTADIGYDAARKIVYVPTFFKNSVAAYQLK